MPENLTKDSATNFGKKGAILCKILYNPKA